MQVELAGHFRTSILRQMQKADVSAHELAKVLDGKVSRRAIYYFLSGKGTTSIGTVEAILDALGIWVQVNPPYLQAERLWRSQWNSAISAYDSRRRLNRRREARILRMFNEKPAS